MSAVTIQHRDNPVTVDLSDDLAVCVEVTGRGIIAFLDGRGVEADSVQFSIDADDARALAAVLLHYAAEAER